MESFLFALAVVAFWFVCISGYLRLLRRAKAEAYANKVRDARILADEINRSRQKDGQ